MKLDVLFNELDANDISVFCDMLSYVSPKILDVEKTEDKAILEIRDGSEDEVSSKVEELRSMINSSEMRAKKKVQTKILEDHYENEPLNTAPIFEDLIKNGAVTEMGEGAYMYSGIFLDVFRYFNRKVEEYGRENWPEIKEFEAPVLTKVNTYTRGLYFENFPHHIMFQTTLNNDISVLDEFSKHGVADGEIFKNIVKPDLVLRHAACVPVYPMLEDKVFTPDELPVTTMISGKCFRNEGHNILEMARVNEFYMKEYVFVGTQEQVQENLEKGRQLWEYWINLFGLKCRIETANDSFFASNYSKLKIFQMLGDSKRELRILHPSSGTECAASSTNVHRTHFTKAHNIKVGDTYCMSGCIAFGIERLTYSLLCQKGLDPSKWDEASRKEVFGEDA